MSIIEILGPLVALIIANALGIYVATAGHSYKKVGDTCHIVHKNNKQLNNNLNLKTK